MDPGAVLQALLGHPDLCSRAWVTRQYDSTVGADTVAGSEHGAAVIRVKGTTKGLVMATDAAERVGLLDPWQGAALAVAECTLNVAVTGARALGVTNCLNYGDPERPEAFWQLRRGSAAWATRAGRSACPSRAATSACTTSPPRPAPSRPPARWASWGCWTTSAGWSVPCRVARASCWLLLGVTAPGHGRFHLCRHRGCRVRTTASRSWTSRPTPRCWHCCRGPRRPGLLRAAQDVSGGGLAVALAEMCLWSGTGADLTLAVGVGPRHGAVRGGPQSGGRERRARRLGCPGGARRGRRACHSTRLGGRAATGSSSISMGQGVRRCRRGPRRGCRGRPR